MIIYIYKHNYRKDMFKQKRAFVGEGGTNTPAGATNQNAGSL